MASVQVYDEIKNHLVASFPALQVIDFDTLDDMLEQGTANFLMLSEEYCFEDEVGFGDPTNICVREVSGFTVFGFVPAPEVSSAVRQLGEDIQNSLRLQTLNGVSISDVSPPEMELLNDGIWSSAAVSITASMDRHVNKQT
jgi:hypothetical protein